MTVKANISFSGPLEAYVSDTITYTATATGSMISMMYAGEQVGCETMIETDPDNSAVIHIVAINKTQPEASFKVFARLETGDEYYRLVKVLDRVTVTGPSWILAGDSSDNPYTYVIEDIKGTLSQFSIRAIKGCTVDPVVDEANKALKIRSSIRLKEESEFVVGAELASGTLSFVHTDVTGTILDLVLEGTSTATVGTEVTVTAKLNYDNLESTFTFALAEGSVPADIDPDKSTQLGTFVFTPKETGTLIVQCTADEYPDIGAKTIEINIIEGSAELTGPSELAVGTSGEYTVAIASGTLDQFKVENEVGCTVEYYQGVEMNILTVAPTGKTVSNATFDVVANLIGGEPMSIHVSVLDPVFILRLNAPTTAYVGRTFWVSASLNVAGYPDTYTWATSGAAATIIQTSDNSVQLKPESVGALVVKCTPAKHGSVQTVTIIVTESDVDYVMVTFNANGGSTEVANMEVISGRSIILPEATRFNKVLVGWSTSTSDVQLVGRSGDRYKVDSSQILYAIWRDLNVERSDCYLSRAYGYDQKGNTLVTETMYFDVVDSIEDTVTANLSSTSTVVFGAANRYIMDLGNSRKFTLNISRANPAGYNDSSTDQRRWSNGKWLREFFNFIDFWQNFGRDPRTGKNTGGFLFHFNPPSDATDLYPTIEKNVFITGTISPSYAGPQKIQLSIPLQVANMDIGGAGNPTEMVTYKSGKSGMFDFTQTFTLGATVSIPSMPIEWQDAFDGSILVAWKGSNGRTYYPNEIAKLTTGMTLTAQWKNCWYRASIENSSWSVIADGRLMIYAVGGGGAGASLRTDTLHVGGGGGAGETRIITIPVRKGDEVEWIIGSGGKASYSDAVYGRNDGEDGENTVVTINGLEVLTSRGGAGGKVPPQNLKGDRPLTGLGGAGWGQGGTSKIPKWADGDAFIVDATDGVKGGNGTTIAPNSNDSVGKGKYGGTTKNNIDQTIPWMGGSGGGASGLNVRVGSATYISRGGDGGYISGTKFTDVEAPVSGVYGGGGGSGPNSLGGAGGSGLVILIFYSA